MIVTTGSCPGFDSSVTSGALFPPTGTSQTGIIAYFLCAVADGASRPESMLKNSSAAIGHTYAALGLSNPIGSDMHQRISRLVKSGIKVPLKKTKVISCKPFENLFIFWGPNSPLSTSQLRQKAVTLLALVCMARPSDVPPPGQIFDPQSGCSTAIVSFMVDMVNYHDDGDLTRTFFATKNEANRSGFEIRTPTCNHHPCGPCIMPSGVYNSHRKRPPTPRPCVLVFFHAKKSTHGSERSGH